MLLVTLLRFISCVFCDLDYNSLLNATLILQCTDVVFIVEMGIEPNSNRTEQVVMKNANRTRITLLCGFLKVLEID